MDVAWETLKLPSVAGQPRHLDGYANCRRSGSLLGGEDYDISSPLSGLLQVD